MELEKLYPAGYTPVPKTHLSMSKKQFSVTVILLS